MVFHILPTDTITVLMDRYDLLSVLPSYKNKLSTRNLPAFDMNTRPL